MKLLLVIAFAALLSGCGSMNPIDWIAPDEIVNPPAELVSMDNQIRIRTLWSNNIGGDPELRVKLAPLLHEGRFYLAENQGTVKALDSTTGKTIWSRDTELELSGGPGIGEGLVLIGTSNAELLALDVESGEERWRARVSSEVLSVPKADLGVAVVHTVDGKLFGFDTTNGEQLWIYDRSIPVLTLYGSSSPVISNGAVIGGFATGKLVSLDLTSGEIRWEANINVPSGRSELERMVDIDGDPLVLDGTVYIASYGGDLAAVSEDTGVVFWRRKLSAYTGVSADWRNLYVADAEGHIWAIDPLNGAALWKNKKLQYRSLSAPVVLGEYVIVGDFEGYLHWLSREDGRLLARVRVGDDPIHNAPTVVDDVLYVYGSGGAVAAFTVTVPEEL